MFDTEHSRVLSMQRGVGRSRSKPTAVLRTQTGRANAPGSFLRAVGSAPSKSQRIDALTPSREATSCLPYSPSPGAPLWLSLSSLGPAQPYWGSRDLRIIGKRREECCSACGHSRCPHTHCGNGTFCRIPTTFRPMRISTRFGAMFGLRWQSCWECCLA